MKERGLFHHLEGKFQLNAIDSTRQSTILQIMKCNAELDPITTPVYVNPDSDNFTGEVNHASCYPNSRVNNVYVELLINTNNLTSMMHALRYDWCPITTSFNDVMEEDDQSGETIGSLLRLQKQASTENMIHPIFNGTDLQHATSLDPQDDDGLTTDDVIEGVTFDYNKFVKHQRSKSLKGLLRSVTDGGLRKSIVYDDRPFITPGAWYKTPSKVKRMNKGCFYGFLLDLPQDDDPRQFYTAQDIAGGAIDVNYTIYFNEYNDEFIQI